MKQAFSWPMRHVWQWAGAALLLALAAACDSGITSGDDQEFKETMAVFGDDRVSDVLKGKPNLVPGTFQEFEKLFKVGRSCPRTDSKEIFVVEEESTRATGEQKLGVQMLPRAVITGCNTDASNPDAVVKSFSLMAALVSAPDAPNAAKGDPMLFTPLEVMALDRRTGTYNFYVFFSNGAGKPGTMVRVVRKVDKSIVRFELTSAGKSVTSKQQTGECFTCHANGGPLMNELTKPWTNWVSVVNEFPKEAKLTGETAAIVSEARDVTLKHTRSSFANDLEQIMRAAIRVWIEGDLKMTSSGAISNKVGFGQMTIEGSTPGGVALLLKSSFCETELNYANALDTIPIELFADPDAAAGTELVPGDATGELTVFQMPVRAEHDRSMELFLQKRGYLQARTVRALRLVDDERDIFSTARCAMYAEVVKTALPVKPKDVDARIQGVLAAKVKAKAFGSMTSARAAYLAALVDPKKTEEQADELLQPYLDELQTRYETAKAKLATASGRSALTKLINGRKDAARKMFPKAASPLPLM
ncbi:MAG: hypothetical protein FJ100_17875 [Deltaproteobacteria bacterium]|nr:hypothetical protein [Deltaproteobacteria bacterium]